MLQRDGHAIAVYNANYGFDGKRNGSEHDKPWSVFGGKFKSFATHAEAIKYAFKQAKKMGKK